MVQRRTILQVADNTGAKELMVIHLYGGSKKKTSGIGEVVLCTVKKALPHTQFKKGDKVKAVIVRLRKETRRKDGTYIRFSDNAAVIIDNEKNKNILGTRIFGPVAREVKEKGFSKIASLASYVV
jgi:large subunit ribosomal protein L14